MLAWTMTNLLPSGEKFMNAETLYLGRDRSRALGPLSVSKEPR